MTEQRCATNCRVAQLEGVLQRKVEEARSSDFLDPAKVSHQMIVGEVETPYGPEQFSIGMAEAKFEKDHPDYLTGNE